MRSVMLSACMLGLALAGAEDAGATAYDRNLAPAIGARKDPVLREEHVPGGRQAPPPRLVDADRDGVVSHKEALTYYDGLFAFLDRNHNGTVIRAEFVKALMPEQGDADERQSLHERLLYLFGTLDGDSDEKLSAIEFMGACDEHYGISDFDGDGTVSIREFRSRAL